MSRGDPLGPRDPLGPDELAALAFLAFIIATIWLAARVIIGCMTARV